MQAMAWMRGIRNFGWLALAAAVAAGGAADAATYVVNNQHASASDANAGSEAAPWRTIQKAANTARAGDTVIVRAGTYNERVVVPAAAAGTAAARTVFRAEPRRAAAAWGFRVLDSAHVRIEGFDVTIPEALRASDWTATYAIFIGASGVEIVDNYIHDVAGVAISGLWSRNPWPRDCYIANNRMYAVGSGIYTYGDNWLIERNEVERLIWRNIGQDADYSRASGSNITFRYNHFHGTRAGEIGSAHVDGFSPWTSSQSYGYCTNVTIESNYVESFHEGVILGDPMNLKTIRDFTIRNNVFVGGALGGSWGVLTGGAIPNTLAHHNVFLNIGIHGIGSRGSATLIARNNLFVNVANAYLTDTGGIMDADYSILYNSGETTPSAHDRMNLDPRMVDAASPRGADGVPFTADDGFRLQSGSPAIDTGANAGVPRDYAGTARPQGAAPDIGVFEMPSGTPPPPAPVSVSLSTTAADPTPLTDIPVTVTFSRAVSGFTAGDVQASNAAVSAFSGSGAVYAITLRSAGSGVVAASVPAAVASAADGGANTASNALQRLHDCTAPAIVLLGANPVQVAVGAVYADAGATAADNREGDISARLNAASTVITAAPGTYTVTYTVSDSLGNAAAPAVRTVNVVQANRAPQLAPIANAAIDEGALLTIAVSATDPDGTLPVLGAAPIPAGARFVDSGNGTGRFEWTPPAGSAGTYAITFRASDGSLQHERTIAIAVSAPPPPPAGAHSADLDGSGSISMSELQRVIQLYNAKAYRCDAGGEDGFAPGAGSRACTPHSADYKPQNWSISLTELLRVVQLYLAGSYRPCPGSEDGFCT